MANLGGGLDALALHLATLQHYLTHLNLYSPYTIIDPLVQSHEGRLSYITYPLLEEKSAVAIHN